jgi:GT2 family glycosyltransferase
MPLLAKLARTAGNVLLTPVTLTDIPTAAGWQRGLLAGAAAPEQLAAVTATLQEIAPALQVTHTFRHESFAPDIVMLLLTGEGGAKEKLRALLTRAPVKLAYGAAGQWYRINLPPVELLRPLWWARLAMVVTFCCGYVGLIWGLGLLSLLRRQLPIPEFRAPTASPPGRTVSFIVPNYNQRQLMDFCLPPLLIEAAGQHPIILVDDASTDDTCDYVWRNYPSVEVVRLIKNQGFTGAVRAGIEASETPLFALINTDVQVRPGFLAALLPHFDDPATLGVSARIELPEGSMIETGNVATAWSGVLEPHHVAPDDSGPILYAGGASSIFDRAKYDALGGFETAYHPFYWEDIELGYRAWRRGWRCLFEPAASVLHQRRTTIGASYGENYANETFLKNGLLFLWKNLRDPGMMAEHCVYVCTRLACEVLSGQYRIARAVAHALPSYLKMARKRWRDYRTEDLGDRRILQLAQPALAEEKEA